jgi:hypothetical protein
MVARDAQAKDSINAVGICHKQRQLDETKNWESNGKRV